MKKARAVVVAVLFTSVSVAEVKSNQLFSDHAVLQSGMPVPVWGITDPGEKVLVILDRQKKTAVAVFDGRWMVKLGKMASGEPFTMTIAGKNTVSTLRPADRM